MAVRSLAVGPEDPTYGAVINQLSDKFSFDVISKGGNAAGKSGFVPAWGSSFNEKQIRDIVADLRTGATLTAKGM